MFPTVTQSPADAHATPRNEKSSHVFAVWVGWRRHLRPSHRSTPPSPTATHDPAAGQATEFSLRIALGFRDHRRPFHRSISGPSDASVPTAAHALAELQDTVSSSPTCEPSPTAIFGVFCSVHRLPSHRSASGPSASEPTAVHARDELHDTALSELSGAVGAGAGPADQLAARATLPHASARQPTRTNASSRCPARSPRATPPRLHADGPLPCVTLAWVIPRSAPDETGF
jgi:hypothetical protein